MAISSIPYIRLASLALVFAVSACGNSGSSSIADSFQPTEHNAVPGSNGQMPNPNMPLNPGAIEDTKTAARTGRLACAFTGECNPAVAMISVVGAQGLERCSGFLISPDQVMTNDHCINKSLSIKGWESRNTHLPCRDFVYIHFSGLRPGDAGVNAACAEIEVRSRESGIASADYAIIKLQDQVPDRAPLAIAKRGLTDLEPVSIYRVQMTNDRTQTGFNGIQTKLDCRASYSTYLYPAIDASNSQLMTFGDCAIQAGNSGSPILNQNGEAEALIQGYLTLNNNPVVENDLRQNLLDGNYGQVAIGTQLSCIKELGTGRNLCGPIAPYAGFFSRQFLSQYGSAHPSFLPPLASNQSWKLINSDESSFKEIYATAPVCTNLNTFESALMVYQKGINRFLQAEWRAQTGMNEKKVNFVSSSQLNHDGFEFLAPGYGALNTAKCSL